MEITVKNLGPLKQARFTLGDLTIICGCNNTGKTYATYALFGFLYIWRRIVSIKIAISSQLSAVRGGQLVTVLPESLRFSIPQEADSLGGW